MEHDNHNHGSDSAPSPEMLPGSPRRDSGTALSFPAEALASCLADLKRQLELRQAMH